MVARPLLGCGVLPSGIMTSHMTRAAFFLVESGKTATGFSMQSELCPSAEDGDRFQHAVGTMSFRLSGRTPVKTPHREFFEIRKGIEFLDLGFAAKVGNGLITIEPDVFQFVFRHMRGFRMSFLIDVGRQTHQPHECWWV